MRGSSKYRRTPALLSSKRQELVMKVLRLDHPPRGERIQLLRRRSQGVKACKEDLSWEQRDNN
jgi:hypothetical protein